MIVYKATNLVNGKVYIGQTARPLRKRIREHLTCKKKSYFDNALAKYGIDGFRIEIIDTAKTEEELNEKERYWIKYYKSIGENGYNLCEGGGSTKGYRHSEENRKLLSEQKKGEKNPFYGKHHSTETRKFISEFHKGRFVGEKNGNYGKHPSEETRKKMSESRRGINSPVCKSVICVETGETFVYMKLACEKYGILPTCLSAACNGRQKTAGGYHWKYYIEKEHAN